METRFPLKVSGYARTSLSATVAITSVKIEVFIIIKSNLVTLELVSVLL